MSGSDTKAANVSRGVPKAQNLHNLPIFNPVDDQVISADQKPNAGVSLQAKPTEGEGVQAESFLQKFSVHLRAAAGSSRAM
jgi:hypothetical protein